MLKGAGINERSDAVGKDMKTFPRQPGSYGIGNVAVEDAFPEGIPHSL